jgi:hypothetical protein
MVGRAGHEPATHNALGGNHRSAEMTAPRLCRRRRGAKPRGREGAARGLRRLLREQLHVNSQKRLAAPQKKPRASRGGSGAGQIDALGRGANQRATRPSNKISAILFPDSGTGKAQL